MPDEQPATTLGGRGVLIPYLAGIANQRRVGVDRLPVVEHEVFAARVRPGGTHHERRVGARRRTEAVAARGGERRQRHPAELAQRPRIHARRARGRREVPRPHQTPAAHPFGAATGVVQIRQPEGVPGLVRHGADRHDLRRIARGRAAQAALQHVVLNLEKLAGVAGPRVLRHVTGEQRRTVGPQVVLRAALRPALPPDRRMDEHHKTDDAGRGVETELGEIDLRVGVRERLSESALQRRERSVAPHAVAVRRAERIDLPALGARVPGVAHLRLAQRHPAPGRALDVEQPVGHLAVEAVIGVGAAERRRGAEEHGVVVGRRKRRSRRACVGEEHRRHAECARDRGSTGRGCPRGERCVEFAEPTLREQAGPCGPHRGRLLAPHAIGPEVEARHFAAWSGPLLRHGDRRRAEQDGEHYSKQAMMHHARVEGIGSGNLP